MKRNEMPMKQRFRFITILHSGHSWGCKTHALIRSGHTWPPSTVCLCNQGKAEQVLTPGDLFPPERSLLGLRQFRRRAAKGNPAMHLLHKDLQEWTQAPALCLCTDCTRFPDSFWKLRRASLSNSKAHTGQLNKV